MIDIYERQEASIVVKAAILEADFIDHGFADLKEQELRNTESLVLASAAMVGMRKTDKAKRNYVFKYVARHSHHAAVLAGIARNITV